MAKVVGVGGIFLRARDPEALYRWYAEHLQISRAGDGPFVFEGEAAMGTTVVAFFPRDTEYFGPDAVEGESQGAIQGAMLNLRVDDLDGVMAALTAAGVAVDPKREVYDYGMFGWFTDPEGNRVELWQPIASATDSPLDNKP